MRHTSRSLKRTQCTLTAHKAHIQCTQITQSFTRDTQSIHSHKSTRKVRTKYTHRVHTWYFRKTNTHTHTYTYIHTLQYKHSPTHSQAHTNYTHHTLNERALTSKNVERAGSTFSSQTLGCRVRSHSDLFSLRLFFASGLSW